VQRIVVLNPKGGSGKTTIATNLAAYYAVHGRRTALMDCDPQGSSGRWLAKRAAPLPAIHGIAAYEKSLRVTRSFLLRAPPGTERVIVDTPAAIPPQLLPEFVREADAILVPVLPSDIDIHACSKCIADLLLVARVPRSANLIGVIANRTRRNTLALDMLLRFLVTLNIPVVTMLRDSHNYLRAAEGGLGVHEMKHYLVRSDLETWQPVVDWLEQRRGGGAIAPATGLEAAV
jgi:chromosome partitioning protein